MTDKEIVEKCQTEEGLLNYLKHTISSYKGFYNCVYLPIKEIPLLQKLLDDGVIAKRKSAMGVDEYSFKKNITKKSKWGG